MKVVTTERGWAGHFCAAGRCHFRRNTLITYGDRHIVVSTVGEMEATHGDHFVEIGLDRYYETMAFEAEYDGRYWDADVSKPVFFESPWAIGDVNADDKANDMHDAVVAEISESLRTIVAAPNSTGESHD